MPLVRFCDQQLADKPHIAVLFADKLGGFVSATPLLRGLKSKYSSSTIDYFGGSVTRELEEGCPWIDSRFSLHGTESTEDALTGYVRERVAVAGRYALAINLDTAPRNLRAVPLIQPDFVSGPSHDLNLEQPLPFLDNERDAIWLEPDWNAPEFILRHRGLLTSGFIGEIFCVLSYVESDFAVCEVPRALVTWAIPDVLIATSATRAVKRWHTEGWLSLIEWCQAHGLSVGMLGNDPVIERSQYGAGAQEDAILAMRGVRDLRGQFSLPQVADALARTRAAVMIDTGLMHIATAVGAETVAIFGNMASPRRLWAPPRANLRLVTGTPVCTLCELSRFQNSDCLREEQDHVCMARIQGRQVIAELGRALSIPT